MIATRTRVRLAPAERRAQIVEVAARQVGERGFNAFTLSRLAEEIGITRAGIEHHFASREEILIEILRTRDELDQVALLRSMGPLPTTERAGWDWVDSLMRRHARQPEMVRISIVLGTEALDPQHPAHQFFSERTARALHTMATIAHDWHPSPKNFAVETLSIMEGVQLQWLRDPRLDLFSLWRSTTASRRP